MTDQDLSTRLASLVMDEIEASRMINRDRIAEVILKELLVRKRAAAPLNRRPVSYGAVLPILPPAGAVKPLAAGAEYMEQLRAEQQVRTEELRMMRARAQAIANERIRQAAEILNNGGSLVLKS